jgi:hypothetical protein
MASDIPPILPDRASPTTEFRRHYRLDEPEISARSFRPGWRVRTHLACLAEHGHIGRHELVAGLAWRTWCETLGRQQTQNWTGIRIKGGLPSGEISEIEMTAARRLHAAAAAIGPERTRLLCVLLVDDARWPVIAAAAGVADPKTAKTHAAEALSALAAWLDGRRVPDPPRRGRGRPPRKCAGTLA